jgi:transposase
LTYIQNIQPGDKTKKDSHFSFIHFKSAGMKRILKQTVGIDVAQKELVVQIGRLHEDLSTELYAYKCFPNTPKGFVSLVQWVLKLTEPTVSIRYVMEATGVYHELLACHLADQGYPVSIILPNKISNYSRTLSVKTITDKSASAAITLFGLERKLEDWHRPKKVFQYLRQLTRERNQLVEERSMIKNRLHAEKAESDPNPSTLKRMKQRIDFLTKQEKAIKEEIERLIKKEKELEREVALICTIPGIGTLTAATILAETNGFELVRNKRQLASYAGFDVQEKQSGTSVKGKTRISKKGNKNLRKAMHLPALTAIRHDGRFKAIFANIVSKHGIKMKAAVAVQRKLLELSYTIFKTQKPYDKNYLQEAQTATERNQMQLI